MGEALTALLLILGILGCQGKFGETASSSANERKLYVYNWDHYIAESTIPEFEEQSGLDVTYDNYASNEEMLAKITAGKVSYDVAFPSDYMVSKMIDRDLLLPLDRSKLENLVNISDRFLDLPFDPKNQYCVPYQWGTTGIGVDTARVQVPEVVDWELLWDSRLKGRISMLDDIRFGFVPPLKRLGASINTKDPEIVKEATDLLIEQKPLVRIYSSNTYMDLLAAGEVWVSYGYSGDIYQVIADKPSVKYFVPMSGSNVWVDNVCILKSAPHPEAAHEFINFLLKPKVAAEIANYTRYATPNEAARPYVDSSLLSDPGVYPSGEVLERCEFLTDVSSATELYSRGWARLKAF